MSRIYFHSPSDTAEVRGSEGAWLGMLCSRLFTEFLDLNERLADTRSDHPLRTIITPGHYAFTALPSQWMRTLQVAASVGDSMAGVPLFTIDGKPVSIFEAQLNTAISMGSTPVRLAARLHGQCEIHAYVEGPHRAWLADVVEAGLREAIFRAREGWEGMVTLLRSRDDEPVVTSYSVCDGFPNSHIAKMEDEEWDELNHFEQWQRAMPGLRADARNLEITPESTKHLRFGAGLTALTILEAARLKYKQGMVKP